MVLGWNTAVLSAVLVGSVSALGRPGHAHHEQHAKLHHRRQAAASGTAPSAGVGPYWAGNGTGPYGSGTGTGAAASSTPTPVVITSVVHVVPVAPTPGQSVFPEQPAGHAPQAKAAVVDNLAPANNNNAAAGNDQCGPATVTITEAATVYLTVEPSSSSSSVRAYVAPPAPQPEEKAAVEPAPAPVVQHTSSSSSSSTHTSTSTPPPAPSPVAAAAAQPKEKAAVAAQPKSAPVQHAAAAAAAQPKEKDASPAAQPSSPPSAGKSGNTGGVKPRGIAYTDLSMANAMPDLGWGCDWDSSPLPAVGHAQGTFSAGQFVPELLGPADVHTAIWPGNSKGASWVMGFNEPNKDVSEGGCGPMAPSDAATQQAALFAGNKAAGQKMTSACVSNDAPDWLDQFLSSSSIAYDALCFHWYGLSLSELQGVFATFQALQKKHGIAEIWMSEWGLNQDLPVSEVQEILTWLDGCGIDRYAYNAVKMTANVKQAYGTPAS